MFGNKKINIVGFDIYESSAMEEYLEQMAEKGWLPHRCGSSLIFKKSAPRRLKYHVEVTPKGSVFDTYQLYTAYAPIQMPDQNSDEEPCWRPCFGDGVRAIYYAESDLPTDQFFSKEDRFHASANQFFHRELIANGILSIIISICLLGLNIPFPYSLQLGFFILYFLSNLIFFFDWYIRGSQALKSGLPAPEFSYKKKKIKTIIQFFFLTVAFALFAFYSLTIKRILTFISYLCFAAICRFFIRILQKDSDLSRSGKRIYYVIFAFIIGIIYMVIVNWLIFKIF